jgi:hypothetical protein
MNVSLIAPCGMNCGICMAYLRERNICHGCLGEKNNKSNHCDKCLIRNCDLLVETTSKFCYDCPKYPCLRLKQLDKRYRIKYGMSMIDNLESIKAVGLQKFAETEEARWLCKSCGKTICVHKPICQYCKAPRNYEFAYKVIK